METILNVIILKAGEWVPKIARLVLIFLIFFVSSKILKKISKTTTSRLKIDENLSILISRTISITLYIFGIVTALGTIGINVTALVASLGLTGFALGFALKDTISNILSGAMILIYRPFIKGNTIKVSGFEGIVKSIDLRYTELESESGKVLIPNSKIFTDPIIVN